MKKHQFEEIVMSLSIIMALLAYMADLQILTVALTVKAVLDGIGAIHYSIKSVAKQKAKKKEVFVSGKPVN